MSIFGKIFSGASRVVSKTKAIRGVSAQDNIGVVSKKGGMSDIFGGLFGGSKKAKRQAEELANATQLELLKNKVASKKNTSDSLVTWIPIIGLLVLFGFFITKKK